MLHKQQVILLGFLLLVFSLFAENQQRLDSLKLELDLASKPDEKVQLYKMLLSETKFLYPGEALIFAEEYLNLSRENTYTEDIAHAMMYQAQINIFLKQYDDAFKICNNLVKYASENELYFYHAEALTCLGRIFIELEDYKNVPEYFFKAIDIYEQTGDVEGIMYLYNNLGVLFQIEGNNEKNLEYKQKALELARQLNDSTVLGASHINLSEYYAENMDYEKAIRYATKALEINSKTNHKPYLSENYFHLADYQLKTGQLQAAKENYLKSLSLCKELNDSTQMSHAFSSIATLYDSLNQIDVALVYADSAYATAIRISGKEVQKRAAYVLQSLYSNSGDYQKAHKYLAIYSHLSDSLHKAYDQINVLQNEMFFKVEKLKQEHLLEENRKRFANNMIFLSLGFSVVILILFFMRQRLKAKNIKLRSEKLKSDLEHKNREMTSSVMSLMKKNEILGDIAEELIGLEKSAVKKETKDAIRVIAQKIRKSRDVKLWEEFDRRFREVHSEFNEKLIIEHPDLSPGELRLCALLKMNMSTKDISELTGTSPGSIDTGRYRLRKKLGLSTDDNIVIYLSKY